MAHEAHTTKTPLIAKSTLVERANPTGNAAIARPMLGWRRRLLALADELDGCTRPFRSLVLNYLDAMSIEWTFDGPRELPENTTWAGVAAESAVLHHLVTTDADRAAKAKLFGMIGEHSQWWVQDGAVDALLTDLAAPSASLSDGAIVTALVDLNFEGLYAEELTDVMYKIPRIVEVLNDFADYTPCVRPVESGPYAGSGAVEPTPGLGTVIGDIGKWFGAQRLRAVAKLKQTPGTTYSERDDRARALIDELVTGGHPWAEITEAATIFAQEAT